MIGTCWSRQVSRGPSASYLFYSIEALPALAWSGWSKRSNQFLKLVNALQLQATDAKHVSGSDLIKNARSSWTPWTTRCLDLLFCYQRNSAAWTSLGPPQTSNALQVPSQPLRRQRTTLLRHTKACGSSHQRSRARHTVCWNALRAGACVPNTTPYSSRCSVGSASGKGGVPPLPRNTKLSHSALYQRGHARRSAFLLERRCALWGSPPGITALPGLMLCRLVSGQCGVPQCPGTTRLSLGVCRSWGTRPLRPPAALLHNAALPSVPASRCAKAPLGAGHRFAPYRVKATGVMQSGLRWSRSHSRRRFPVVGTPYAPRAVRPCGCRGTWGLVRRCAQCFWSVACGQSCCVCPAHPWASPLRGIGPERSARPPPRGSLSPRAACPFPVLHS